MSGRADWITDQINAMATGRFADEAPAGDRASHGET